MTDNNYTVQKSDGTEERNTEPLEGDRFEKKDGSSSGSIVQRVFLNGTYDAAFLSTLSNVYIVGGMMILFDIVLIEILRTNYELELDHIQVMMVFVRLPWDYKILYGIICETVRVPITRSFIEAPKRGYLLIISLIEFICLLLVAFVKFSDYKVLVWLFFIISITMASSDTVIDGICCVQQRKDPERGAQDLQTYSWLFYGITSMTLALLGGYMVQQGLARETYIIQAVAAFGIFCSAYRMSIYAEMNGVDDLLGQSESQVELEKKIEDEARTSFCERVKRDWKIIKNAFSHQTFYRFQLYVVGRGLLQPMFYTYQYQQWKETYELSQVQIGFIKACENGAFFISFTLYYNFFSKFSFRTNTYISQVVQVLVVALDLAQVYRINIDLGISDVTTICCGAALLQSFFLAVWHLPSLIVVQKLAPEGVEATIIAICATIHNFFLMEGAELLGAFINAQFVGVTKKNLENYSVLVWIQLIGSLISFAIIPIVPSNQEINNFVNVMQRQRTLKNQDKDDEYVEQQKIVDEKK